MAKLINHKLVSCLLCFFTFAALSAFQAQAQTATELQQLAKSKAPTVPGDVWADIQTKIKNKNTISNNIVVEPTNPEIAQKELDQLKISTQSSMGAIVYNTGGLVVKDVIRIWGSGSVKVPRKIAAWNKEKSFISKRILVIADDVFGGLFAVNAGGLGVDVGKIYYFAPDTLKWESLNVGYTQFLGWALDGAAGFNAFYGELPLWTGWEKDVKSLKGEQVLSVYPPLWSNSAPFTGKEVKRSYKAVPFNELFEMQQELASGKK